MLMELLIIFIIATIILFILSVYTMEEYPMLAIPIILVGMICTIICAYGFWNVEYFYIAYNNTLGNSSGFIYSTMNYGDPYSYIFMFLFFIYCALFVKTGFNMWSEALQTKNEMEYNSRRKRGRKL